MTFLAYIKFLSVAQQDRKDRDLTSPIGDLGRSCMSIVKRFFSLFFAISLIFGCSSVRMYSYHSVPSAKNNQHQRIYPVYIDKSFPKDQLKTITSVIDEWNNVLNGNIVIEVVRNDIDNENEEQLEDLVKKMRQEREGLVMLNLNHDNELITGIVEETDGTLAFVNSIGNRANVMVVVGDRIGRKNLHKILLHEFGHAFGANHTNAQSLMYPYYSGVQMDCVDKITVAQVANYHGFSFKSMNYCSTPNFE